MKHPDSFKTRMRNAVDIFKTLHACYEQHCSDLIKPGHRVEHEMRFSHSGLSSQKPKIHWRDDLSGHEAMRVAMLKIELEGLFQSMQASFETLFQDFVRLSQYRLHGHIEIEGKWTMQLTGDIEQCHFYMTCLKNGQRAASHTKHFFENMIMERAEKIDLLIDGESVPMDEQSLWIILENEDEKGAQYKEISNKIYATSPTEAGLVYRCLFESEYFDNRLGEEFFPKIMAAKFTYCWEERE